MNKSGYIDYQDCKYLGRSEMLCSGLNNYQMKKDGPRFPLGGFEIVDLRTDQVIAQMPIELWTESGLPMTQNPFWIEATADGPARVLHAGGRQVDALHLRGGRQVDGPFRFLPRPGARRRQARAPRLRHVGDQDEGPPRRRHRDGRRGRALHPRRDREALSAGRHHRRGGGRRRRRPPVAHRSDRRHGELRARLPRYCVSIGYLERGVPTLGAIYDPSHDWLYAAARGEGAWHDGERMRGEPDRRHAARPRSNAAGRRGGRRRRTSTCSRACWTPGARSAAPAPARSASPTSRQAAVEAYAELHINAWDCAAGIVLVQEAGGFTNDFFAGDGLRAGNPLIATNAALCGKLAAVIGIPIIS